MSRMPVRKAPTAAPRRKKPAPKQATVVVTFKLPVADVDEIIADSLLEAAERRYPKVHMTYEVSR